MAASNWTCSECGTRFGPPRNGKMVCVRCGAIQTSGVASGREAPTVDTLPVQIPPVQIPGTRQAGPGEGAVEVLELLDQSIAELASEAEALRVREQGAPLELGCALFGVFSAVVVVLALFSTIARSLFGSWAFYVALVIVILGGLYKLVPKIMNRAELSRLARQRDEIELTLSSLRTQRERLQKLDS